MRKLNFVAASLASLAIVALTPFAAHADVCNQCYGGCIDAYGDDNSQSGLYALSQCFNGCLNENGARCMDTLPPGG